MCFTPDVIIMMGDGLTFANAFRRGPNIVGFGTKDDIEREPTRYSPTTIAYSCPVSAEEMTAIINALNAPIIRARGPK